MKRRGHERMVVPFVLGSRLVVIVIGCVGFSAAGIWMIALGTEAGLVWQQGLGVLSVAFFGGGGLFWLLHRLAYRDALIIDCDGIIEHASAMGAGFLPWESIARFYVFEWNGQKFLGIEPVSLDDYLARCGMFKRWAVKANLGLGLPPVIVAEASIDIPVHVLASRIAGFVERNLSSKHESEPPQQTS